MKKTLLAAVIIAVTVLFAGPVDAKQKQIEGDWTFAVEHLPLKLVLVQKDKSVTGSSRPPSRRRTGLYDPKVQPPGPGRASAGACPDDATCPL